MKLSTFTKDMVIVVLSSLALACLITFANLQLLSENFIMMIPTFIIFVTFASALIMLGAFVVEIYRKGKSLLKIICIIEGIDAIISIEAYLIAMFCTQNETVKIVALYIFAITFMALVFLTCIDIKIASSK